MDQKRILAVELVPMFEEQARERMLAGKKDPPPKLEEGHSESTQKATKTEKVSRESTQKAAKVVGISRTGVTDLKKVKEEAPDLYEKIENGELTLAQAKRELKERERENRRKENMGKIRLIAALAVEIKRVWQKWNPQGNRKDLTGGNISTSKNRDLAGHYFHVSGRYIDEAERILIKDPEMFDRIKRGEITISRALDVKRITSDSTNVWNTPKKYIDAARKVMGDIDVDPASNESANETIRARIYYTEKTNGLIKFLLNSRQTQKSEPKSKFDNSFSLCLNILRPPRVVPLRQAG